MVARCDDHATCRVVRHELSAYPSLKSSQITNEPDATLAVIPAGDDGHGNHRLTIRNVNFAIINYGSVRPSH
jgi:hypothetical protein